MNSIQGPPRVLAVLSEPPKILDQQTFEDGDGNTDFKISLYITNIT